MPPAPTRSYRSALREAEARRTRSRLLEAATAIFLDRGYAGTTMRAVANAAGFSVPTVEALFGTKARLLKAAIDVAIAGDDEPVAVLDRPWARSAEAASSLEGFLSAVAEVAGATQLRSAGLVLAVFEGSSVDAGLHRIRSQMVAQREATATWIVRGMTRLSRLRSGCGLDEAVDVVWLLLDPAVFVRLTRERRWSVARYQHWIAETLARLIMNQERDNSDEEEQVRP